MKKIDQFLPTFDKHDAIGNETIEIQRLLLELGYDSEIFAENIHSSLTKSAKHYSEHKNNSDLIIYHHSIGSDIVNYVLKTNSKKIMIYHNITPIPYFKDINQTTANLLKKGIEQLAYLKNRIDLAVGDSEFNRLELENLGYDNTGVLPILINFELYKTQNNLNLQSKYGDSQNFLYVGRIAPNKRIDEIIKVFTYYHLNINSNSNLFLLGKYSTSENYFKTISKLISDLKIKNIHFVENPDIEKLSNYYSISTLLLILSEHEGFCVPLVESMHFKIPIFALNSTAIPYTLGNSGVLINDENFEEIAELINLVLVNDNLKNSIIAKQTFQLNSMYKNIKKLLSNMINQVK